MQVLDADVVVRPVDRPLQLREVALRQVGADGSADVLTGRVVDRLVGSELGADSPVGLPPVRFQVSLCEVHLLGHGLAE